VSWAFDTRVQTSPSAKHYRPLELRDRCQMFEKAILGVGSSFLTTLKREKTLNSKRREMTGLRWGSVRPSPKRPGVLASTWSLLTTWRSAVPKFGGKTMSSITRTLEPLSSCWVGTTNEYARIYGQAGGAGKPGASSGRSVDTSGRSVYELRSQILDTRRRVAWCGRSTKTAEDRLVVSPCLAPGNIRSGG